MTSSFNWLGKFWIGGRVSWIPMVKKRRLLQAAQFRCLPGMHRHKRAAAASDLMGHVWAFLGAAACARGQSSVTEGALTERCDESVFLHFYRL